MSETAHTPGPWTHFRAEKLSHDAPEIGPNVSDGGIMGNLKDDPRWVIEGEIEFAPDARLIVAAPNMREAIAFARHALAALEGYERDLREELSDDHVIGRIPESRSTPSFNVRAGHIRMMAAALAKAEGRS